MVKIYRNNGRGVQTIKQKVETHGRASHKMPCVCYNAMRLYYDNLIETKPTKI